MKGPYTTTLRSQRDVLDVVTADGTLATHLRFVHLRAHEWLAAEIVDTVDADTVDSKGTEVRHHTIYVHNGHTVMQR